MKLIDADALKEHKFLTQQVKVINGRHNGKLKEQLILTYQKGWNDCIDAIIDNAPTVEQPTGQVNCSHCDYLNFSKKIIDIIVEVMTKYGIESVEDLQRELDRKERKNEDQQTTERDIHRQGETSRGDRRSQEARPGRTSRAYGILEREELRLCKH